MSDDLTLAESKGPPTPPPPSEPSDAGQAITLSAPDVAVVRPSLAAESSWPALPGYEILAELGRGGMGVVYQARQVKLNRLVALKMILAGGHAGQADLARFVTEAQAIARLQHPNIVQIHEVGEHGGLPFFSLEFCSGGSLDRKLAGTPLAPREAAVLVETLARAMQAAHDKGVVHRDLKPANVLLAAPASGAEALEGTRTRFSLGTPKVTDFGLAKKLDDAAGPTATGSILGTPSYMAPEQAGGHGREVGPAADIYALGALLYECLTGRPPFRAATPLETVLQVISAEPVPPARLQPGTPRDLETICLKCLEKEPRKRYATAAALAADLRAYLDGQPITARPVGRLERAGKWARRNKATALAAVAVLLALVSGTIVSTYFALAATSAAERADQEKSTAQSEAERARQQERIAEESRHKAEAAEQEQKRLAASALRANARHEIRDDNAAAALELLTLAHSIHADPSYDLQITGLLSLMPRPVLLGRHSHAINHLAASADGARIVTGSNDGTVRIWDAERGVPVGEPIRFPGTVFAVALSPDGSECAAAGGNLLSPGKVIRYATRDGRQLAKLPDLPGTAMYVAYTPAGRLITGEWSMGAGLTDLLAGKLGKPEFAYRLHDRDQKKLPRAYAMDMWGNPSVRTLSSRVEPGHGWVLALTANRTQVIDLSTHRPVAGLELEGGRWFGQVTADGRYAVVVGGDNTAHVLDLQRRKAYTVPLGYGWSVQAIAVDERGQLAAAFHDGFVQRYTLADGRPVPRSEGMVGSPGWQPLFSSDGAYLAAAGQGGVARVWRTDDRQPICPPLRHGGAVTSLSLLAGGRRLAAGVVDGTVRLWDLATDQRPVFHVQTNIPSGRRGNIDLRFLADGRFVLAGGGGRWVEHPDKLRGARQAGLKTPVDSTVVATAITPDGSWVFSGTSTGQLRVTGEGPSKVGALEHANKLVLDVNPSRDGRYVATRDVFADMPPGRFLGNCQVWDTATGKRVFGPVSPGVIQGVTTAAAVARDRVALAGLRMSLGGSFQSQVQVYDLATRRPLGPPLALGVQLIPEWLALSPDGRHLAVAATDFFTEGGEISLWDVQTGRAVLPPFRISEHPWASDFSPDGRWLAVVAGSRVLLFDTSADRPPAELQHSKGVGWVRFNRSGSLLVTAAQDQVFLWDPISREPVRPPLRHDAWVTAAAVSPSGQHVVAVGTNGVLIGWQIAGGPLDPDTTVRLSHLLSCSTVKGDRSVPAGRDLLEADWAELRRAHPGELRSAADVVDDWYIREFNATASTRRFRTAAQHLEATWPTNPGDWNRFLTGLCYLAARDQAGVRRAFAELARIAESDPSPSHLTWAIEIGLHDGDALRSADQDRAVAFASKLPTAGAKVDVYGTLAHALALIRAGRLRQAEEYLELARKDPQKMSQARADAQLAVIRRLQGRAEEAKKLADAAAMQIPPQSAGLEGDWIGAIFVQRLVEEARRPLAKPAQ
jgi:WD40 repeat protein